MSQAIQQPRIDGHDLITVAGIRFEWNSVFNSYFTVAGEPRALMASEYQEHALKAALGWLDTLPKDLELPAMPGFDRDWVDRLVQGQVYEEDEPLTHAQAIGFVLEWIEAVPAGLLAELPPIDVSLLKGAVVA